jgi:hypothetical protein
MTAFARGTFANAWFALLGALVWGLPVAALPAQLPGPAQALGHEVGADGKLADYGQLRAWWAQLDAASDRMLVETIGTTSYGQPMVMATLSAPANLARLDRLREIARRLARGEAADEAEARALAREGVPVVWIDGGLHATETIAGQNILELVWRIASRDDDEVRRILDRVVLLVCPANPDGMEMIARAYRATGRVGQIPVLYQRYIGHDNNRDHYRVAQPETEAIARQLYRRWYPQIVYNHHQTAPRGTVIFTPPFRDPFHYQFDPILVRGIELVATHINARFAWEGKPGVISRGGASYSTWWNGGLRTTAYFHNQIGILTEVFGSPDPVPLRQTLERRLPSGDYPMPVGSRIWHARDTIEYLQTANFAILDFASRYGDELQRNAWRMARNAIERGSRDSWTVTPRMIAAARAAREQGAVVGEARDQGGAQVAGGAAREGGAARRDGGAQVAGGEARGESGETRREGGEQTTGKEARREGGAATDSRDPRARTRRARGDAERTDTAGGDEASGAADASGDDREVALEGPGDEVFRDPALRDPRGYVLTADQDPVGLAEFVRALQATGIELLRATREFELSGRRYPAGSYVARAAQAFRPHLLDMFEPQWHPDDIGRDGQPVPPYDSAGWTLALQMDVRFDRLLDEFDGPFAPVTEPVDIPPPAPPPARTESGASAPRVGLFDVYGGNMAVGWTEWVLRRRGVEPQLVFGDTIEAGALRDRFDVLLFHAGLPGAADPTARTERALERGSRGRLTDEQLERMITALPPFEDWSSARARRTRITRERGLAHLREFVAQGGTLIALGDQVDAAIRAFDLPVRAGVWVRNEDGSDRRARRSEFYIPGSLVRLELDPRHPLTAGSPQQLVAVWRGSTAFELDPPRDAARPNDSPALTVVASYAATDPLVSGWALGIDRIAGKPAILEARIGRGRVLLFGPDVVYRGQPHGTHRLLLRAVRG